MSFCVTGVSALYSYTPPDVSHLFCDLKSNLSELTRRVFSRNLMPIELAALERTLKASYPILESLSTSEELLFFTAVLEEDVDAISCFTQAGRFDFNACNSAGHNVLHRSCQFLPLKAISFLLKIGTNPQVNGLNGDPLLLITYNSHNPDKVAIIDLLISDPYRANLTGINLQLSKQMIEMESMIKGNYLLFCKFYANDVFSDDQLTLLCLKMAEEMNISNDTPLPIGQLVLYFAIHLQNVEAIAYLNQSDDIDLEYLDSAGRTCLHRAAEFNLIHSFRALVALGANLDATVSDKWGYSVLQKACIANSVEIVREILSSSKEVSEPKSPTKKAKSSNPRLVRIEFLCISGNNALHVASNKGSVPVCRILIQAGADINARTVEGGEYTALLSASYYGNALVVDELLQQAKSVGPELFDAVLKAKNNEGSCALTLACEERKDAVIAVLKKHGAVIDSESILKLIETVEAMLDHCDLLAQIVKYQVITPSDLSLIHQKLVGWIATEVNPHMTTLELICVFATMHNRQKVLVDIVAKDPQASVDSLSLDSLHKKGFAIDPTFFSRLVDDTEDFSKNLMLIANYVIHDVLSKDSKQLLRKAAIRFLQIPDTPISDLQLLFVFAVMKNKTALIPFFLAQPGMDINAFYFGNQNALHTACQLELGDMAECLIDAGADINLPDLVEKMAPVHFVSLNGSAHTLHLLLLRGANPDVVNTDGYRPIHLVAERGDLYSLYYLDKHGADIHAFTSTASPKHALHLAAMEGEAAFVEELIGLNPRTSELPTFTNTRRPSRYNTNIEVETNRGYRAIHLAALNNHENVCRVLLKYGAKADALTNDAEGDSVAHLAITSNLPRLLRFLINQRPLLRDLPSAKGFLPIHAAAFKGNLECSNILLSMGASIDSLTSNKLKQTPLCFAVYHNKIEIVASYIEHKKKTYPIELRSFAGRSSQTENATVLLAVQQKFYPIADLLISAKAWIDFDLITEKLSTFSIPQFSYLLQTEMHPVNKVDSDGLTLLHSVVALPLDHPNKSALLEVVLNSRHIAEIDRPSKEFVTPIQRTIVKGEMPTFLTLMNRGAAIDSINVKCPNLASTPLSITVQFDRFEMMEAMLNHKKKINPATFPAFINQKGIKGSALSQACDLRTGHRFAALLIQNDATIMPSDFLNSALRGFVETVKAIFEKNAEWTRSLRYGDGDDLVVYLQKMLSYLVSNQLVLSHEIPLAEGELTKIQADVTTVWKEYSGNYEQMFANFEAISLLLDPAKHKPSFYLEKRREFGLPTAI